VRVGIEKNFAKHFINYCNRNAVRLIIFGQGLKQVDWRVWWQLAFTNSL